MSNIKDMVVNESVEDVVLFLAPRISYPRLDGIYVRHNFAVIQNGDLLHAIEKLVQEGKLSKNELGNIYKGPNWSPPQFVKDKKYGIK